MQCKVDIRPFLTNLRNFEEALPNGGVISRVFTKNPFFAQNVPQMMRYGPEMRPLVD